MANYNAITRTNYFRVRDRDAEDRLIEAVNRLESDLEVWYGEDADGRRMFAFGGYDRITGYYDEVTGENDRDAFLNDLSSIVAEDDAIIIFESGHEKLRYVVGAATVITAGETRSLRIEDCAVELAAKMLGVERFDTDCDY